MPFSERKEPLKKARKKTVGKQKTTPKKPKTTRRAKPGKSY